MQSFFSARALVTMVAGIGFVGASGASGIRGAIGVGAVAQAAELQDTLLPAVNAGTHLNPLAAPSATPGAEFERLAAQVRFGFIAMISLCTVMLVIHG